MITLILKAFGLKRFSLLDKETNGISNVSIVPEFFHEVSSISVLPADVFSVKN